MLDFIRRTPFVNSRDPHLTRRTSWRPKSATLKMRSSALSGYWTLVLRLWKEHGDVANAVRRANSNARQQQQLPKWQAKQQAGKYHENDTDGFETKALSDCCNQEHRGEQHRDAHILVSRFSRFCSLVSHLRSLFR